MTVENIRRVVPKLSHKKWCLVRLPSLSPFLFNFVIDEIMIRTLEGFPNPGVHVITGVKFVYLEYADDIVLVLRRHNQS